MLEYCSGMNIHEMKLHSAITFYKWAPTDQMMCCVSKLHQNTNYFKEMSVVIRAGAVNEKQSVTIAIQFFFAKFYQRKLFEEF